MKEHRVLNKWVLTYEALMLLALFLANTYQIAFFLIDLTGRKNFFANIHGFYTIQITISYEWYMKLRCHQFSIIDQNILIDICSSVLKKYSSLITQGFHYHHCLATIFYIDTGYSRCILGWNTPWMNRRILVIRSIIQFDGSISSQNVGDSFGCKVLE